LDGRSDDDELVLALGGEHARYVLDGAEGGRDGLWPRVWAARGLLHVWDDLATEALIRSAGDEAWRVREMVAKVVARHHIDPALEAVLALRDDSVPRVRAAAERAVQRLTEQKG
jgi:hypothetical protein